MLRQGEPLQRVEQRVTEFVAGTWFGKQYPTAHAKWAEAEALLWAEETTATASLVGHLLREALMAFTDALVSRLGVQDVPGDSTKVVARMRAIIQQKSIAGSTATAFLDALLAYWGTVSDLVQRQEHAAQREGEQLLWEDSRRLVFQSAVVMYEIHRSVESP
jgi:hypothetical protein